VRTVRLGRRIYDNLRKAMGYILAVHVVIAGLALLPLILGWPLMLMPIHIAFLEMVIDPVCSIVFEAEPEERDVMRRMPRDTRSSLISGSLIIWGLVQGVAVFISIAIVFAGAVRAGMPEGELRALVFTTIVATNFGLIFVNRSFSASIIAVFRVANPALWGVLATASGLLSLILLWPPARSLFHFGPLHLDDLLVCFGGAIVVLAVLQALKPLWRAKLTS
jgi:Ca2+-transporting ATPase